jgi:PTS system fructose-specific IIC component
MASIADLIDKKSIDLNCKASEKKEAIERAVDLMCASGAVEDREKYINAVFEREKMSTTAVGGSVAIPHAKSSAVKRAALAAVVFKDGVDFDAPDGEDVKLLFLIAAPETKDNVHLEVLGRLSVLLMDSEFTESLIKSHNTDEFLHIIKKGEEKEKVHGEADENLPLVLAVTACPTGIAHTYMAAEALERSAESVGVRLRVETRGSGGAKGVFTESEIENAVCVIIAADTKIPQGRFDGKKVIFCPVSDGISKSKELLLRAKSGDAPIFHSDDEKDNGMHGVYRHLMNGVSHMLPFVVGGGILIAIAFLIDSLFVDLSSVGESVRENFGSITPAASLFKGIGDVAFNFMLPILAGFISYSIADKPALAVGVVGGAIASAGTSGFLGAILAGFLSGYLVLGLKKALKVLPESLEGIKTVLLYPLLGIFLTGIAMEYIVEPPVGWFNEALNSFLISLGGSGSVFLGMILGAMMGIDMGGPINKAAYLFGTMQIASGNYAIMASVMVGGMVPPLAIAVSSLVFKGIFDDSVRKAAPANIVMGLSFITEGAIPYAAADPARVIPACAVGGAVAGGMSMAFGCTLMAPHGGIFVFPVVGKALLYLVSLAVGTAAGAALLGVLKGFSKK